MALNFPDSPTLDQIYHDTTSGFAYKWNGAVWQSHNPFNRFSIKKIDDISSSFNGSTQSFALQSQGNSVSISGPELLRVVLGGIVQDAGVDYTANGSSITFTTPPQNGLTFSGVLHGSPVTTETYTDGSITPQKLSAGRPNWNASGDVTVSRDLTVSRNLSVSGDATINSVTVSAGATINGLTYPVSDGSVGEVLLTNGSGSLSFGSVSGFLGSVVEDTTPQLGGNLDLNSKSITGTGSLSITGIVTATDFNTSSDLNLKENIHVIENPLSKVLSISGVTFNWKDGGSESAGVIAQEIEEVLPQLVKNSDDGKTVNYNGLIGLLVEAVKDLTREVEELKGSINK